MPIKIPTRHMVGISLLSFILSGCFQPPYNNFQDSNKGGRMAGGTLLGTGIGTAVGAFAGYPAVGAAVGGGASLIQAQYRNSQQALLKELKRQDIELIRYGDTMTLLVPTDRYFIFNTAHLNNICYPGLENIVKLLKHACGPIYVAAFTDDVGSRHHKKYLSQAQAEAMLTFLWANGIPAQRLHAEGYGDKHDIGDNRLIHGSAYNRRIEIQWFKTPISAPEAISYPMGMK